MTKALTDEVLKIVITGHVDHGKSTLVGRLFHETNSLPKGKFEEIQATCKKRGMPFEWAFLTDALQAERTQGVTIDTTQIWFSTAFRRYVLVDAPGHREFIRNMVTGAAACDAAFLLVDAKDGVKEQTRRHAYLLWMLGVKNLVVLVNKMDSVSYSEKRFQEVSEEITKFLTQIGITPRSLIPISAGSGDNISKPSAKMKWWKGSSVVEALDNFKSSLSRNEMPLRLPIQDIYKFDARRIIVGRVESGTIKQGDELRFSPGNRIGKVKTIESGNKQFAVAGENVGITLAEQIFTERGDVASSTSDAPIETNTLRAKLFWLHKKPLEEGNRYAIRFATTQTEAVVEKVENIINTDTLKAQKGKKVGHNQVGEVVLRCVRTLAVDEYATNPHNGKFVLFSNYQVAGGGIINLEGYPKHKQQLTANENIFEVSHKVTSLARSMRNSHRAGILWLTGLSASGKSTIAIEAEKYLFLKGYQTYALDGDNLRKGLNVDLGFTPDDRTENIRRIAQVAKLFAESGNVVIVSCISPYRDDRRLARQVMPESFFEVYINASLAECAKRDPKGLYKKAQEGEVKAFSGVSAPYEVPQNPNLTINTEKLTPQEAAANLVDFAVAKFGGKK